MLPKTESEMFSKSLVGQMVLMIMLEENVPDWDVPPILDRDGNKWILMAIFLVEDDAVFIGDVDAEGIPMIDDDPYGVFAEVDDTTKDIWDLRVRRGLIKKSDDYDYLGSFLARYALSNTDWRYIFPAELYNSKFAKSAINYQQVL
tara:strand:- start:1469 stop:1906 length:438 start_codon:yes stop_codon:yes gene_type:complete